MCHDQAGIIQRNKNVSTYANQTMTPWIVAPQTPVSMELFRQEYWSGLSSPSPGGFPNPGIEPGSPTQQVKFFTI